MDISGIETDIEAIERDAALFEPSDFCRRVDAIEFIEFQIIDRMEGLLQVGQGRELSSLRERAERVHDALRQVDEALFHRCREKIRSGAYIRTAFVELVRKYCGENAGSEEQWGYDYLDVFINGLLYTRPVPEATMDLAPDMVFYQKTPVRIVLELLRIADLGMGDVFFDIGSGLGQAAILVSLISGSRSIGVEYDPAFCSYATATASALHVNEVAFIQSDARLEDFAEGTVFFLYTPFEGGMLRDMLKVLEVASVGRPIRIFTYGPCSSIVARQPWLRCMNGDGENSYTLYGFRRVV